MGFVSLGWAQAAEHPGRTAAPSTRCHSWPGPRTAPSWPWRIRTAARAISGPGSVCRPSSAKPPEYCYAIEPPDDDNRLIVGIEKANNSARLPAAVYKKVPRRHPELPRPVWAVEPVSDARRLTIRQWHDQYRTDRDHRTTDKWPLILAAANDQGRVERAAIVAVYEETGSTPGAADKAIHRWLNAGKLLRHSTGVYQLPATQLDPLPLEPT